MLVVRAPLWLSAVVGGSLFLGLYLIGSHNTDRQITREARNMTGASMQKCIAMGLQNVKQIRRMAYQVREDAIRMQLVRICDLADRIFHNFEQDPSDAAKASRFLLYLDRFLPLIERYARLSATREGRLLLERSGDEAEFRMMLNTVEQGFTQGFENYLQNDVIELRTFGRVLKKMMDVAEIGK